MTDLLISPSTYVPWSVAALALVLVHAKVLLPRQPEPAADVPGADTKPSYAHLANWRLISACVALCLLCQPLVMRADIAHRPAWAVWSSSFVVLVAVDAASTWIPRGLTRLCLGELAVGVAIAAAAGQVSPALVSVVCALVVGAGFWLLWRVGSGLGFAVVRMAVAMGGLAGLASADFTIAALVWASIIGAVWGIIHRLVAGPHQPFAYAPALWAGPWVAALAA